MSHEERVTEKGYAKDELFIRQDCQCTGYKLLCCVLYIKLHVSVIFILFIGSTDSVTKDDSNSGIGQVYV